MPKYYVHFQVPAWFQIDVEADDEEEALEKAFEVYDKEVHERPEISDHLQWDKVYETYDIELLTDEDSSQMGG
jgi:hypothetical protein